jgi:TRAP-type uncharacterized transport system substrate-binding protein
VPHVAILRKRLRDSGRGRLLASLATVAFLAAAVLAARLLMAGKSSSVTISGGNVEGLPILKAMSLDGEVPGGGLLAKAVVTKGSVDMLERVDRGELDFALVQGGFDIDRFRNVRQVAGLNVIPLALLVKEEYHGAVVDDFGALRRRSINLGSGRRTGTYWLSRELLEFAGLAPGDYHATNLDLAGLLGESDREKLPDAVFLVSLPTGRLLRHLLIDQRFRLVPLPFGEAFRANALEHPGVTPAEGILVRKEHIPDARIPEFSCGVSPAIPPRTVVTVGSRVLLITHRHTRPATVVRVLETMFNSRWANAVQPPIDKGILRLPPEAPLHPGTVEFRDRDQPLITGESLSFVSSSLQILVPTLGGLLFLREWLKKRNSVGREQGIDQFLAMVSEIERCGYELGRGGDVDDETLRRLHHELSDIKGRALQYVTGREVGADALATILFGHVDDVRSLLSDLHERAGRPGGSLDARLVHVRDGGKNPSP